MNAASRPLSHRLLLSLFALSCLWLGPGCSINPATGERQLSLIGESREIEMGRQSNEDIVAQLGIYPDPEVQAYVRDLGRRVAAGSERPDLPWTFQVVDDPVVNAFALPGGFVYITRGILTYFNSEAQLVSVLGHEVGHVTARHGVERASRAQLAQLGLGIGMIASERFRRYGDLAQMGLGLLFLKYSRDDERQADELGLRYLEREGYDPQEMNAVFSTLGRASRHASGGDRIPGWMSTHPTPENRIERIERAIADFPGGVSQAKVGREGYLERVDGMVFGDDPRQGYFKDSLFRHPEMAFELTFPDGWKTQNTRQSVQGASAEGDAVVVLTLATEASAQEAARAFLDKEGVVVQGSFQEGLEDVSGVGLRFLVTREGADDLVGRVAFLEHGDRVFRLLGLTTEGVYSKYEGSLVRAVGSFRQVTDRRVLGVEPRRVELVTLPRAMSLEELQSRYPSAPGLDLETLAILNGVELGERLPAGTKVKRVVGKELP